MKTKITHGEQSARSNVQHIQAMHVAYQVLIEGKKIQRMGLPTSLASEVRTLLADLGGGEDAFMRYIHELPLEVRTSPDGNDDANAYVIVLSTGGPHTQLTGPIGRYGPETVSMEWSDWGEHGEITLSSSERASLLWFVRMFFPE